MTPRDFAIDVVKTLQKAGFEAYWAGGCVRDELLDLTPIDYDIATNGTPDEVRKLFRRTLSIGAAFGVIEIIGPKRGDVYHNVQVATFRSDGTYTDGRRPDSVTFGNAQADAQRRDFTINGLFYDPVKLLLIDYVGGQADLKAKLLRAIGDPVQRFKEDKLRILRAVRMASRFGLQIDAETFAAMKKMAAQISVVSTERIAEEIRKMLKHANRSRGLQLMEQVSLFTQIIPEIIDRVPVNLVAELPEKIGTGQYVFEVTVGLMLRTLTKKQVESICKRLKLSNDEMKLITFLVENHQALDQAKKLPRSKLYPLLAHEHIHELLAVHYARRQREAVTFCEFQLVDIPREKLDPLPWVTGDDLRAAGLKPGPNFKTALDWARVAQLDGICQFPEEAIQLAVKKAKG